MTSIRGSITIELALAACLFLLFGSAIVFALQGSALAGAFVHEELEFRTLLERARNDAVLSYERFALIGTTTSTTTASGIYELSIARRDHSRCVSDVTLRAEHLPRGHFMKTTLRLSDTREAIALGSDCAADAALPWAAAHLYAAEHSGTENVTALDALSGRVYAGLSESPFLATADLTALEEGQDTLFAFPEHPPDLPGYPNALDAVQIPNASGVSRVYAFLATNALAGQFAVLSFDDPLRPVILATSTLSGVAPVGSYPEGWRVFYYDHAVYITTRETAGPELHVFDVTNPAHPTELGTGFEVGSTIHGFTIARRVVSGTEHTLLFAALGRASGEVGVYDVTNPVSIHEITAARTNLPGDQDGESVALLGTELFLGRASNTGGPELYVFDASNVEQGLTLLGSAEVGTNVTAIMPSGTRAFLAATPSGSSTRRLQIFDIEDPAHPRFLSQINTPGGTWGALEYADDFLVLGGESSAPLRIFKSL